MDAEAVTPSPPRSVGRTVFTQTWAELSFLHWAVEPERLAPYLPRGVRADVIDGVSYVGLVPFRMQDIGAWGSPGVPYLGSFLETNVRLYSVDEQGRRGVVFVSLDASRLAPVLAARWGPGLPYLWSRMRYQRTGDLIDYRCRRRWPGPRGAASQIRVRVGQPIEAGPLEHFLTARWGLHLPANRRPLLPTRRGQAPLGGRTPAGRQATTGGQGAAGGQATTGGRDTYYWPNSHPQWPLHAATLEILDDNLLTAAGFGDLTARPPDSVLFSPGVHAIFGPRQPA